MKLHTHTHTLEVPRATESLARSSSRQNRSRGRPRSLGSLLPFSSPLTRPSRLLIANVSLCSRSTRRQTRPALPATGTESGLTTQKQHERLRPSASFSRRSARPSDDEPPEKESDFDVSLGSNFRMQVYRALGRLPAHSSLLLRFPSLGLLHASVTFPVLALLPVFSSCA